MNNLMLAYFVQHYDCKLSLVIHVAVGYSFFSAAFYSIVYSHAKTYTF
jgi:hypothetical protein